jgi:signal transduction histidine kinase
MRGKKSLARRVVFSTIASAAIGGALTALFAILAVDRLVADHADQRLAGAAVTLAGEIDENHAEGDDEPLTAIVADENTEIAASGISLGVFRGQERVAGGARVPFAGAGSCVTHGALGERTRSCGRAYGDFVLVASQASDEGSLRFAYVAAGLGALLLSGLFGALASTRLTRWALLPLTDLTERVRRLPPRGAVKEQLGTPSDCEEIEAIHAALVRLIQRHGALLQQAHRFASDAAHELRTPLTTLAGELELLVEEEERADRRETLGRLRERTLRLSALVERLLVLASPLAEQKHAFDAVALSDLLADVVAELPGDQRARVNLQVSGEGLTRGEPSLLHSLFSNAIENALKFSGNAPVYVELMEEEGRLRVDVRDRGTGVPPGQRQDVFEPLYRANPGAAPGHGLGLALIGHIVRAHDGSAEFVDTERGACLRVRLPGWTAATA